MATASSHRFHIVKVPALCRKRKPFREANPTHSSEIDAGNSTVCFNNAAVFLGTFFETAPLRDVVGLLGFKLNLDISSSSSAAGLLIRPMRLIYLMLLMVSRMVCA